MCSSIVWQSCYVVLSSSRFLVPIFSFCPFTFLKTFLLHVPPLVPSDEFIIVLPKSDANVVQLPDTGNMAGVGVLRTLDRCVWNESGSVHWC